jgi:hypothetical protein
MLIDIQSALRSFEGVRKFDDYLADLIRSDRHDELERMLAAYLATVEGPVAAACRDVPLERIQVTGWGAVERELATVRNYTAVGIDLSTYAECHDASGTLEVVLETNFYTDEVFEFSTADRAVITAACKSHTVWQGDFSDIGNHVGIDGLNRLHALLTSTGRDAREAHRQSIAGGSAVPDSVIEQILGEWWVVLRLHQAIQRDLAGISLARRVPIIVGNHGNYPQIAAVYYPSRAGRRPEPADPITRGEYESRRAKQSAGTKDADSYQARKDEAVKWVLSGFAAARNRASLDPQDLADLTDAAKLVGKVLRKRFSPPTRH